MPQGLLGGPRAVVSSDDAVDHVNVLSLRTGRMFSSVEARAVFDTLLGQAALRNTPLSAEDLIRHLRSLRQAKEHHKRSGYI